MKLPYILSQFAALAVAFFDLITPYCACAEDMLHYGHMKKFLLNGKGWWWRFTPGVR